jgi:ribonuclease Z
MRITLLGTGSPLPSAVCAGPSTLVQTENANILVDAGRGVVMRLTGAMCPPPAVTGVLLTHLHSDHICGLNDVVTTRWVASPAATPLPIWGPPGTAAMVAGMMAMLGADIGYRTAHHDDLRTGGPMSVNVIEVSPGDSFVVGDVTVSAHRTDHRPVEPSVGFRLEHDGAVAALAGDGIPCAELDELCRDADYYVQTVIREDLVRTLASLIPTSQRFLDILDYHSTVEQAAQTAARAGVKTLVLTHFVPPLQPGQEDEWRALAAAHFPGDIIVGPDLTAVGG